MVTQISGEVAPDALGLSELAYVAFVLHDIGPERIAAAKSRALIERPPLCPRQGGPALGRLFWLMTLVTLVSRREAGGRSPTAVCARW